MAVSQFNRKPTFLGQALLIVLPVLVLTGVGFFSLRQDKRLVHGEAAERAQGIAEALLPQLWAGLSSVSLGRPTVESSTFQVDAAGRLLLPGPVAPWPIPKPLLASALTPEQEAQWRATQPSANPRGDPTRRVEACRNFLASGPPAEFAARATYALGLLLAAQGDTPTAVDLFQTLLAKFPEAIGESGVALQPLAQLKLLQWETNRAEAEQLRALTMFCSNIVFRPTPLTPVLLQEVSQCARSPAVTAEAAKWTQLWTEHQRVRSLYAAAVHNAGTLAPILPPLFWFTAGEISGGEHTGAPGKRETERSRVAPQHWLASRGPENSAGAWFSCQTESEVVSNLYAVVNRAAPIPEYFGIEIEVGGRRLPHVAPSAPERSPLLARTREIAADSESARTSPALELLGSVGRWENGKEWLRVNVYLTSPATLYVRQNARRLWFGSLIALSAMAALIGLLAAWRAFERQQRLSELKSNFVSSVSHELRTPVASVRLLAESLERGKISDLAKQGEYLRLIGQECRRLSALVDNLLDFSHIEQGRKEYEFEPTDMVHLVQQTVQGMALGAAERHVSLAVNLDNTVPATHHPQPLLDGRAIQQALVNLIDNAIKHSPEGRTVTVGMDWPKRKEAASTRDSGQTDAVALWVKDQGSGIPREEQEKIFERFYRRGSELRRETRGIGIGLAIVKHIVEAHGGRVVVESTVGQGSRFIMELPLARQPEKPTDERR